jgi:glycosyltransferase involved in cell wall biosynthesis
MKFGILLEETWDFFHDIYQDLSNFHQTSLFQRRAVKFPFFHTRLNRYLLRYDLLKFMKKNDAVFFEFASELLMTASHLSKSCPIVTRLHRYEMYKWVDLINWEAVDKIIFVSQAKKKEFINRFPNLEKKTEVIPVSVSLDKFRFLEKEFMGDIGILCHFTPRKRVYDLILTFRDLLNYNNNFHLHIGGGEHVSYKDYALALRSLVLDLDMEEKVTFYGHVNEPKDWYPKVDIFISNSYSEGLQVAPMEAMASGCYPLVHHWRGAEELVPEENLFYTSQELISKILKYSETPDVDKKLIRNRIRSIACEKFDINNTTVKVRKLLEEVVSEAPKD